MRRQLIRELSINKSGAKMSAINHLNIVKILTVSLYQFLLYAFVLLSSKTRATSFSSFRFYCYVELRTPGDVSQQCTIPV